MSTLCTVLRASKPFQRVKCIFLQLETAVGRYNNTMYMCYYCTKPGVAAMRYCFAGAGGPSGGRLFR
jgi:hypothetical protein